VKVTHRKQNAYCVSTHLTVTRLEYLWMGQTLTVECNLYNAVHLLICEWIYNEVQLIQKNTQQFETCASVEWL